MGLSIMVGVARSIGDVNVVRLSQWGVSNGSLKQEEPGTAGFEEWIDR